MSSQGIHTSSGTPEERFTVAGGRGSSSRRVTGPRPPSAEAVPGHSPSLPDTPAACLCHHPQPVRIQSFHLITTQILLKRMNIKNGSYISLQQ